MRTAVAVLVVLLFGSVAINAQSQAQPLSKPRICLKAEPDFAVALTAAFVKKDVPVIIVLDEKNADYVLQSTAVSTRRVSDVSVIFGFTGWSAVSVQLVRKSDNAFVWAYQVRKEISSPMAIQSLSEAIAKHLKHDFLEKGK